MRRSTASIPCSSFKQGMITVILCDLYTLTLVPYSHEVVLCPGAFCRLSCRRNQRGPQARQHGLHPAYGQRHGSVSCKSADDDGSVSGSDRSAEGGCLGHG